MVDLTPRAEFAPAMVPAMVTAMGMPPPPVGSPRRAWPPLAALLLAAAALAWQAAQALQEGLRLRAESAAVASLRGAMDGPTGGMSWATIRRHEALAAVARCLAQPWGEQLAGLERLARAWPTVQLHRLAMSGGDAQLVLELHAATPGAQAGYDAALRRALPGAWSAMPPTAHAAPPATQWQMQAAWPDAGCRPATLGAP